MQQTNSPLEARIFVLWTKTQEMLSTLNLLSRALYDIRHELIAASKETPADEQELKT